MGFNKAVEETMKTGLDVLRTIASMLSIEAHASTCLEKMRNSQHLVLVDKDVHNIIVEMMLTVVRSCAVSLKGTADKAVGATVSASELQDMVEGIISTAKSEAADAARRDAEYEERKADATAMGDLEGFLEAQSMKGKVGIRSKIDANSRINYSTFCVDFGAGNSLQNRCKNRIIYPPLRVVHVRAPSNASPSLICLLFFTVYGADFS